MLYPAVRIVPQINGTEVGAANCGPCTAAMSVDFATGGRIRVGPLEIRRRMHNLSGPTDVADQVRAVKSYDDEAIHVGLEPLNCYPHLRDNWDVALAIIMRGEKWLGLVVNYGVINQDLKGKRLSGDKAFMGDHFFGGFGYRVRNGIREIRIFDPLADGRRKGIPTGPTWWPLDLVHRAMTAHAGPGRATFTVVPRAIALPKSHRTGVAVSGVKPS